MINPAYLAGLFDGDGGIRIREDLFISVSIANTYKPVLELLSIEFGGAITMNTISGIGKRQCFSWNLPAGELRHFLEFILPYSIIKRKQVLVALLALQERAAMSQGVPVPDKVLLLMAKCKLAIDKLNKSEYT